MRPHLSINVKSLETSVDFYTRIFGVAPQKQSETYAKFDLKEPHFNFSMHEVDATRRLSHVNHLGIEVMSEGEVAAWQKNLDELGIETMPEEGTDCCFALQDKVWFKDPDGHSWEIFYVHHQLPVMGTEPPKEKRSVACTPGSGCC